MINYPFYIFLGFLRPSRLCSIVCCNKLLYVVYVYLDCYIPLVFALQS
jgi:hypothetical protein